MRRKMIGGLVALNVFLLAGLAVVSLAPDTIAQVGVRRAGDYVMVAGETPGRVASTVYIADLNNAAMLAVTFDAGARQLREVGFRLFGEDFERVRQEP